MKNAKSKAMARKQPTAPAFEGFGFFLPRAALNLGIQSTAPTTEYESSKQYSRRSRLPARSCAGGFSSSSSKDYPHPAGAAPSGSARQTSPGRS